MAISLKKLISLDDKEIIYSKVFNSIQHNCDKQEIIDRWTNLLRCDISKKVPNSIEHIIAVGLHDVQGD